MTTKYLFFGFNIFSTFKILKDVKENYIFNRININLFGSIIELAALGDSINFHLILPKKESQFVYHKMDVLDHFDTSNIH